MLHANAGSRFRWANGLQKVEGALFHLGWRHNRFLYRHVDRLVHERLRLPLDRGWKTLLQPHLSLSRFLRAYYSIRRFWYSVWHVFLNRLPRHNHPAFEHPNFGRTGDDKFMIVVEAEDPKFDEEETGSFLKEIGGKSITMIKESID